MKKALSFILVSLFLFSCHKNKNTPATCDSYSIGMTVGNNITLVAANTTSGDVIKNYRNVIQLSGNGVGVYDHIHSCYYLCGLVNATHLILYRLNTMTGIGDTLGVGGLLDTVGGNLICNSTTGKLYFIGWNYYLGTNSIYEVSPNATGFSSKLVCYIPSGWNNNISSPVIDESTGYIYYVMSSSGGSANEYTLMKVNSAGGSPSFVANTYTSALGDLIYNNNDSLFYGVKSNINLLNVSFISIDPATGVINTIVDSINNYVFSATFDYCNNLYVYGYDGLDPATGKLVKTFSSSAFWENAGIY